MGLELNYLDGQTPIDEDEKDGLLIETISTRRDLDEFEQLNIEEAIQWLYGQKFKVHDIFSEKFVLDIHKRMFGNVWGWAGTFRKSNKNIGVDKHQISVELKQLCDDGLYWVENCTYSPEEIAIRFKHRIVSIHCFSNGNGRHSRLMGDIIVEKIFALKVFTWGADNLSENTDARTLYIAAVKAADQGDFEPLLNFARL